MKTDEIKNIEDIKKGENNDDSLKFGMVFKALRIVQDKALEEMVDTKSQSIYAFKVEQAKVIPTLITFLNLCKTYNVKPSDFMEIAEKAFEKDLSFREILLLCAKYESYKNYQNTSIIDSDGIDKKLGLILKSMRVSQCRTIISVAKELSVSATMISNIEKGKELPTIKKFKKYSQFFKMPDEDFEKLYCEAITKNLSYPQILEYCLVYDIERQEKENIQTNNF